MCHRACKEAAHIRRLVHITLIAGLAVLSATPVVHAQLAPIAVPSTQPAPPPATEPDVPLLRETVGPGAAPGHEEDTGYPVAWHIVKQFDFNEAPRGNDSDLPMYWYRFGGKDYPDFPRYARGWWDREFGCTSKESFRLDAQGGNVGYYYQTNTIPIAPGQDIRVDAMVRVAGTEHSRAVLEVSLNDTRGEIVPGSIRRSELVGGRSQNDRWIPLSITVPGKFPTGRFVNLSVFILQPQRLRQLDPATRDKPALVDYLDVHARAWIDNLMVYRLPRVMMTTGQPGQLLPANARSAVRLSIEGFPNQPLEAELNVYSAQRRLIGHDIFRTGPSDRGGVARTFEWPAPANLPAGLYRAELSLYAGGARETDLPPLLTRHLTFAQLPADPVRPPSPHLGLGLVLDPPPDGLEDAASRQLAIEQAAVIAIAGASTAKLPLWRTSSTIDSLEQNDPWSEELVHRLVQRQVRLVATFGQVPAPLLSGQTRTGDFATRRSLLDVFSLPADQWRPYVAPQLARFAEQIRYWQIGTEDAAAFGVDDRFAATVGNVRREFRTLLTASNFVATWPGNYAFASTQPDHRTAGPRQTFPAEVASLYLANTIPPEAGVDHLAEYLNLTATRPWVTIQPLDDTYQREPRLADLAWRLVTAATVLAAPEAPAEMRGPMAPGQIFMPAPWSMREMSGVEMLEPTEDLLVFRTAAQMLNGTRYGGRVALADGVMAHIFDRGDGTGVMAVQNAGADPATPIAVYLAEPGRVTRVDLLGNRLPAEPSRGLVAGRQPFYLDGIDPRIARLRGSFCMEPRFVPSTYKKHVRSIRFVNPFDAPITGRLTLHFPQDWEVHPKIIPFNCQPGEVFSREVDLRFPYNVEAGVKQLTGDFQIDADRTYQVQMHTRYELGLDDVQVKPLTQWLPGDELLVTLNVTNRSESKLDLFCFVAIPDRPRQERLIAALGPGASAGKSFTIPNAKSLVGQSLRVGVREVRGSRIVNYDVPVR